MATAIVCAGLIALVTIVSVCYVHKVDEANWTSLNRVGNQLLALVLKKRRKPSDKPN